MERDVIVRNYECTTAVYGFVKDIKNWLIDKLLEIGLNSFVSTAEERDDLLKFYSEFYKAVDRFHEGQFVVADFVELKRYDVTPMTTLDT